MILCTAVLQAKAVGQQMALREKNNTRSQAADASEGSDTSKDQGSPSRSRLEERFYSDDALLPLQLLASGGCLPYRWRGVARFGLLLPPVAIDTQEHRRQDDGSGQYHHRHGIGGGS